MKASTALFARRLMSASLFALFALPLGCVGHEPVIGDGDGDQQDPDGPGGGSDDPDTPIDATGMYRLDSRFDLISGMPGTVGQVTNTFIDMTDDPYDPATWLIDTILEEWNGGFVEDLIEDARPVLDGVVLDVMMDHAPELVQQILDIGDAFGQVTRQFGVDSTLDVRGGDADVGLTAVHTVSGYHFSIDGTEYTYDLASLGSDVVVVGGVGFSVSGSTATVAQHGMPLRYGGFLALVLDEVIIPMVAPGTYGLEELLQDQIDCYAIGLRIYQEINFMSADFYAGLCETGIEVGANYVMDRLISIDQSAQVVLQISGQARAMDGDGDRRIDRLTGGAWSGVIDYAGNQGPLADGANVFTGDRM